MKTSRFIATTLGLALATLSMAQSYSAASGTASGLKDTSNLRIYNQNFRMYFQKADTDPDVYINDAVFQPGSNWDNTITLNEYAPTGFLGSYQLGTVLTGNVFQEMFLAGVPIIDSSVLDGIYDLSFDIRGGSTNLADDLLATVNFELDVRQSWAPVLTLSIDQPIIEFGQTANVSYHLENTSSDTIQIQGAWLGGEADGALANLDWGFSPGAFSGSLDSGGVIDSTHSFFTPKPTTPNGIYPVYAGVVGGYHNGDQLFVNSANTPGIEVVPEPATLTILGLAGIAALRRKRN